MYRVTGLGLYEGSLAGWVRDLKYRNQPQIARPLGALLAWPVTAMLGPSREQAAMRPALVRSDRVRWDAVIVPVPLHRERLQARGYNQASLLAQAMGQALSLPVDDSLLMREGAGPPQAGLDRVERLRLLSSSFAAVRALRHVDVLLVDDVLTTGATLEACAGRLVEAGARRVLGCVAAAGVQRRLWA